MSSIITKMRKQKAILLRRLAPDKYGKFAFDIPVEISCRWEDVIQEFLDHVGEKRISQSVVYVDRVVKIGDRLMRGELTSSVPNDPLLTESFEVKQFNQLPNLKATESLLTAYL